MSGWGEDDDEGPDADYGVFGDAGMPRAIPTPDPKREAQARKWRTSRDQAEQTSRDFNSYMIDLFNARKP